MNEHLTNIQSVSAGILLYTQDIAISGSANSPVLVETSALIYTPVTKNDTINYVPVVSVLNQQVYAIDIPGYVTAVENHIQLGTDNNGDEIWSVNPDRWLPAMNYYDIHELSNMSEFNLLYGKSVQDYPFGLTRIYFTKYEYECLTKIPKGKDIIRVYYLKVNVSKSNS